MEIVESVNSPGKGHGTGDDRYGSDEAAGTAWVVDGATDLTDLRVFRREESDAAWLAEALSHRLLTGPGGMSPRAYLADVLADVQARAIREAALPMDKVPPEALPLASAMWVQVRAQDGKAHFAWMGDCCAIMAAPGGPVRAVMSEGKPDRETETMRAMAGLSREEKLVELRRIRAAQNTKAEHAIWGMHKQAIANLATASEPCPPGTDIVLMTDGLWRLVEPYGLMDATGLMALVREDGLTGALDALRAHEASAKADSSVRFKSADDACAVWMRG